MPGRDGSGDRLALWKKQALEHLRDAFSDGRKRHERAEAELQSELYQQIGQFKVELDWVKKKLACSAEAKRRVLEADHPQLSITRQCQLLGLARATWYCDC